MTVPADLIMDLLRRQSITSRFFAQLLRAVKDGDGQITVDALDSFQATGVAMREQNNALLALVHALKAEGQWPEKTLPH